MGAAGEGSRPHGAICWALLYLFSLPTLGDASTEALPAPVPVALAHPAASSCDRMFVSSPDGPKNGTFSAPSIVNPKGHAHQCLYTFLAAEGERVQVNFMSFNLRGTPPECATEYLDLYMEIADPTAELIDSPFGGRVCGRNVPKTRISMHRALVAAFFTLEKTVTPDLFSGYYEFIDAGHYIAGTPYPEEICSFTVYSSQKREGEFLSPTYPGVYPKNLQCRYRFLGIAGQRVRLEFMDFDLFYGGSHCPFDYVKVFDGPSMDDPLIGVYCGQQRNLVVYSSTHNLFVYFSTLPRMAYASNRGFAAWYEFSERFVSLSFIQVNESEHIRGTECDQKILSRKESSGYVCSPNFPFPFHPNVVCRYYIYGMQDSQDLERVRLKFESFEVSRADPECPDGHVKLYLQGQEERAAIEEFDHVFCGDAIPPSVLSEGPRLVMVFNSGSAQGLGFKAKYTFETDYKVPGTASPNGSCIFQYTSESRKTGDFNSPRHPANYPSATRCEYYFYARPEEQIKFVFNYFKTKTDIVVAGYNEVCVEDWLEILEVFPNRRERKIGRYCGRTAPGPVVSDEGVHTMKAVLHTDSGGVASGFLASYTFLNYSSVTDCGRNITDMESGVITSPGFPAPYRPFRQLCNWYISVKPNYRVLLSFDFFLIEGSPTERGCPGAVIRIWKDLAQAPIELCGSQLSNDTREIVSTSSLLKLTFMTADKAVGSAGFKCTWTQIQPPNEPCEGYICPQSHYCISQSLRCNDESNCGLDDKSDEDHCVVEKALNLYLVAGSTAAGSTIFLLICCYCCHRKRKRRRHRRRQLPPPYDRYRPREVPGLQFVSDNL